MTMPLAKPPAIRPGARVALVAPAGPLPEGAVDRAIRRVAGWGWTPDVGRHARRRTGYLAGLDDDRLSDLNAAIRDPAIDAIWFLRGGYGTMRIVDRIDWEAFRANPRPLIGFSDNTALHLAAYRSGVISFHGPHAGVEPLTEFSADLLRRLITDPSPPGVLPVPAGHATEVLRRGVAMGPMIGGNLSLLAALAGTRYTLDARGAILFIEEVAEPAYRVDRMLSQLRMCGSLEGVAGVVVGAFSETPASERDDIPDVHEVILERFHGMDIPILAGLPFGHIDDNWTLPLGVTARLDTEAATLELLEPAVS